LFLGHNYSVSTPTPDETMKDNSQTDRTQTERRSFLEILLGGGIVAFIGTVLYPVSRFLIPPKSGDVAPRSVKAGMVGDLKPNDGAIFRFGTKPGILVRTQKDEYRAFSAVCTHLDCTVQYRADFGHIWCACHNGHYDLRGINIEGPPPRPLEEFDVSVVEDEIFATRKSRV